MSFFLKHKSFFLKGQQHPFEFKIKLKSALLFLMLFCIIAMPVYGQNKTFRIKMQNAIVRDVLKEVENKTGYRFFFSDDFADIYKTVNIDMESNDVTELLSKLFQASTVTYKILENNVVVITPVKTEQKAIVVSGTVTDNKGETIPGVNVSVKGTTIGQVTDSDGKYSISVQDKNAVLEFSYMGYLTNAVTVGNQTAIDVQLKENVQALKEVVVVGYGTQKKENLTGAVSQVNMDKILGDRPITNVGAALQGAVPGLLITGGASPGGTKTFNIRGMTSITKVNGVTPSPLILVDNVECQIDLINPEDIETVTVLKDAASSAIYGARAAFGVILITTKKAKKNSKMTLNYNNNFAFSKVTNGLEQASVKDIVTTLSEWSPGGSWYSNGQPFALWSDYLNEYEKDPKAFENQAIQNGEYFNSGWGMYIPKTGAGTGKYFYLKDNNSQNEIFDRYGFQQTHNISTSGGGDKITYRLSFGYLNNNGPLKTNKDSYERYTVASYVSADVASWMNTAFDIRYSQSSRQELETSFGSKIFNTRYFNFFPGADSWTASNNLNGPVYLNNAPLNYILYGNPDKTRNENPRIFSKTTLTPFKGFEGIIEYTFDENVYDRKQYPNSINMRDDQMLQNPYSDPTFRRDKSTTRYNSLNAYGTYSLSLLDKHNFKLMAGYAQEGRYYESLWASRKGAISPDLPSISGSVGDILAGDNYTDYSIRSGFFRFNYNYAEKYLLEVNGRYDGSSKFPTNHRFGFFPSASLGWQVARENFMKWSSGWLNEFKLRGSYGEIGNQDIDNYRFLPGMDVVLQSNWIYGGQRPTTLNQPPMVSSNFTWERAATLNLGTDISMLNNRLQATFEWYRRETIGMLGPVQEYPAVVGANAPLQNVANLRTKGYELSVNWRDKTGDWGYSIGFNLSDYRSFITKFLNESKILSNYYVGQEFGEIWGYRFDRYYTVDDFVNTTSWALKPGVTSINGVSPRPGDILWKNLSDKDGKNEINNGSNTYDDPGDQTIIGNNTPRYQFGANFSVSYKDFSLSAFAQGVGKRDVWLGGDITFPLVGTNATNENGTMYKNQIGNYVQVVDAAKGDYTLVNPNALYPRIYNQPGAAVNNSNRRVSDRYLLDASYLRVKNITLSYSIPRNLLQTVRLSNARLFVSAEDALTFSRLPKGVDPERISWGYPFYAVYSCGVNITF